MVSFCWYNRQERLLPPLFYFFFYLLLLLLSLSFSFVVVVVAAAAAAAATVVVAFAFAFLRELNYFQVLIMLLLLLLLLLLLTIGMPQKLQVTNPMMLILRHQRFMKWWDTWVTRRRTPWQTLQVESKLHFGLHFRISESHPMCSCCHMEMTFWFISDPVIWESGGAAGYVSDTIQRKHSRSRHGLGVLQRRHDSFDESKSNKKGEALEMLSCWPSCRHFPNSRPLSC